MCLDSRCVACHLDVRACVYGNLTCVHGTLRNVYGTLRNTNLTLCLRLQDIEKVYSHYYYKSDLVHAENTRQSPTLTSQFYRIHLELVLISNKDNPKIL